jgi:hypothetical protein
MLVLRGPLWDIYVIVTLALAGGVARTVYTDPNIRRAGDEGPRRDARGASAQLARRDGPWSAREVGVFIPGHVSSCEPARVAGADGWEEEPEVFLGGRRRTLGQAVMIASAAAKHALQGSIASGSGAYVARAARAPGGVALAASAIDPGSAFAAAIAKAQQWHWCGPPIETMFLGVVGIVRCTIMLSLYTGMARVGGCGAWISSSIIMWKDHW